MLAKLAFSNIRRRGLRHFSLVIDYAEFLDRDEQKRSFYEKLKSDDPEAAFKKPLTSEQIEFTETLYEGFFKKMELEEKNLYLIGKIKQEAQKSDKAFVLSKADYFLSAESLYARLEYQMH